MGNFFSTPLDSHIRSGETFRDIYVVSRPLESSQRSTHPRAVPSQERPEPVFHWAVRVGGVVYELEKRGAGVIAFGYMEFIEQDWSTKYRVGGTILTDDQLKQKGSSILPQMPQKYSTFPNDYQDFVLRFLEDIGHGRIDREKLSGLVLGRGYKNPLELMGRQIILTGYGLG